MEEKLVNGAATEHADTDKSVRSGPAMMILYLVTVINQICMFAYMSIMPFLYRQYGMDAHTYGYCMSLFCFLTLLTSPIIGRIADKFGPRCVLIFSNFSSAAAQLTMGLAGGIPLLLLSRTGSLLMDILPAAQMAVTDWTSEKERGRYLGQIMIPISIGMIAGPTLAGFMSSYFGSQQTLMITWLAPLVGNCIILAFVPTTSKQNKRNETKTRVNWAQVKDFLLKGDVALLMVVRVLSTLPTFMMCYQVLAMNTFDLSPRDNGLLGSSYGIMNMINNWPLLTLLGKHFTNDQLLAWVPVLDVLAFYLLSQASVVWALIPVLYLANLSYSILDNQVMTRLTQSVDAEDTSTMVGVGSALFYFSRTLTPTLSVILTDKFGTSAVGQFGVAVNFLMASLTIFKYWK